ncbi:hypothetical protein PHYBOEH_006474 [Phytophthora boehmeriae]|uniref:Uncharacterized protein n=1 Tax=Phytophthora boehmeriae TaxID=109152 RepID=A0A8T1WHY9_9STRA|nr:hypothetical protein PHYBOEH_006474 [Phytophthora boehmeriae]
MQFFRPLTCFVATLLTATSVAQLLGNIQVLNASQPNVQYFVRVVQNGESCDPVDRVLSMCASKDFVCRMDAGKEMFATSPSCLAYDPSVMQDNPFEIEETSVNPWGTCDPNADKNRQAGSPPVCKRDFQCQCLQGSNANCICAPPDAVKEENGAIKCGRTDGKQCDGGQYCHYLQQGGMECGQKPYFS